MAPRVIAAFFALAALGGCFAPPESPARSAIEVTSSAVTIAGPSGFCVDPSASRSARDQAFVVLGSCAAISNRPNMPQPDVPVVLTAAVARGRTVSPDALEAYFNARMETQDENAGRGTGFEIQDVALIGEVVFIQIRDRAHPNDWRGILGLDPDVTITLAVRAGPGTAVSPNDRFAALRAFAAQIVRANGNRLLGPRGS